MYKSALLALGTAIVAVSSINEAQAASPSAKIATAADVRATIKDDLGLKSRVDPEGDILIEYAGQGEDDYSVWIILEDENGDRVDASIGSKRIASMKILCYVATSSDSDDFVLFRNVAQSLNEKYKLKHYAYRSGSTCALALERHEFVTSEYRRAQLCKIYKLFMTSRKAAAEAVKGK